VTRVLAWLGMALATWAAYVWITGRPARRAQQWEEFNHQHRARAGAGDTITDIEYFLRRQRHGA